DEGQRRASIIIEKVREYIEGHPYTKIDYINICNTETMEDVEYIDKESVLALAVWVGFPRLIDNYVLGESLEIE
ncbi:MAG: pantoate--beta-alanine ligase, partial [Deltaproteobacteria bacterium]|nr:pantoate--beta-alanine ligase [Deltaproteobacteria bacterium]